ncbi:hypothetical protein D3C87_1525290 [compost metagenome]
MGLLQCLDLLLHLLQGDGVAVRILIEQCFSLLQSSRFNGVTLLLKLSLSLQQLPLGDQVGL